MLKLAVLALALGAVFFAVMPAVRVHASDFGLGDTAKQAGLNTSMTTTQIIGRVISIALGFVGTIFFVLMVYAGFLWMTARGNEKTVERAKDMIIAAIVGLVIVVLAYAITNTIITGLTAAPAQNSPASNTSGSACTEGAGCSSDSECGSGTCLGADPSTRGICHCP